MSLADYILAAIILAFIGWIAWELYRAPVENFDADRSADEAAADECIAASRPAELRPHVRAITEPRSK